MTRATQNQGRRRSQRGHQDRPLRYTGLLLVALAAAFLLALMIGAAIRPGYDFREAAISDLGVFPETALLFNGSLALVAVLNLFAGYYFYRVHGQRWLFGVFVAGSVGALGTGLFPLGSGPVHQMFAFVAFLSFNLEAIGSGRWAGGILRYLSTGVGLIGLAFLAVFVLGSSGVPVVFGLLGYGGTERMIIYPALLWALVFGGYLLGQPSQRDRQS